MSRIGRRLLIFLLVLVILFAACAVTVAVLFNKTFEQLGVSDVPLINGKTIADMNLEGYKPVDVWPLAKSLFKDNSSLMDYAPNDDDLAAVNNIFKTSSISLGLTGVHYSELIYSSATFVNSRLLIFTDKQLCALLNSVVKQAPNDLLLSAGGEILAYLGSKEIKEILDLLEEFDVTVEQIKLLSEDDTPHLELLISLDISKYTQDFYLPVLGKINSRIYVTVNYRLNVDENGFIKLYSPVLFVNGNDAKLSQAVLDGLFIAMNNDENSDPMSTKSLTDGVSAFVGVVFEHVGCIGNGSSYGLMGVDVTNRTICLVSH
ncbi:MAG: hypothetical protein J1F65_05240 [Clostridiales bacterium]|nr:hypothetical protein [Clostridiales bacterium]